MATKARRPPMTISWRESLTGNAVVTVFSDPYTVLEWRETVQALAAGRSDREPLRLMVDGRDCTPPTAEFIVRALSVFEMPELRAAGGRVAIVVSSDAAYSMGRLTEAAVDIRKLPLALRTFRDWAEAERWIGRHEGRTPQTHASAPPDRNAGPN